MAKNYSASEVAQLHKRTIIVVMLAQFLGGAGLAAGITVGALLAQELQVSDSLVGLPQALFTLGAALASWLLGNISNRSGRRVGLSGGFLVGAIGAVGVVLSAIWGNVALYFCFLFIYGSGSATNMQARYAGTDLAPAKRRAFSVSMAMVSTTFGAVVGPNMVATLTPLAEAAGAPGLCGVFMLAAVAYALAATVFFVFLRPDPLLVAKALAANEVKAAAERNAAAPTTPAAQSDAAPAAEATETQAGTETPAAATAQTPATHPATGAEGSRKGVALGAFILIIAWFVMAMIMTMTPVQMRAHDHALASVGMVVGLHVGAMYFPSLVTGLITDRIGWRRMAVCGGVTLIAAAAIAAWAPADSLAMSTLALLLLGIGWNLGFISGTTLVVASSTIEKRARTQGNVDVLVSMTSALAGGSSSIIAVAIGFTGMSLFGAALALAMIVIVIVASRKV
ncbi:MAG: MFS transporter [Coriobacteriales bacterium]|nr:MFS transporter [Coriobacteriales bacterium]